jgi:hypothetical protein
MMMTAAAAIALAAGELKANTLFPTDDGELYSTVISLSRATHGWLYDYANASDQRYYPYSMLIGVPIWPDNRFKVIKFWEPSDDATEGQ